MKRLIHLSIIAIAVALLGVADASAQKKSAPHKYVDASTLTIINKAQDDGMAFKRLDAETFSAPKSLENSSTGIAILFRTDSRFIEARWTTSSKKLGNNMTPIFHSGLDLYIRENGEWIFAGVGRPKINSTEHKYIIVNHMADGMKECMLYLPMFNCVTNLELGVSPDAVIEAIPSPFKYKIMVVGSSITHGASASRPGGAYVARMGRALNAETPNIGLSGRCKLDDYFANIVCGSKADAYIFDTFSNSTAKQIDERLYNFVKRITEAHPGKPMIFLQTIKRDIGHFNLGSRKRNDDQREAAVKGMERICKEFKHVYFINPGLYTGEDLEGTIDGTHLNDLGVQRTLDNILPKIKKILKKYKIK